MINAMDTTMKNGTNDEEIKVTQLAADNMRVIESFNSRIFFTLILNGVKIYDCSIATAKNGHKFISWPQRKGKDGKYYNTAYARIADDLQKKLIEKIEMECEI